MGMEHKVSIARNTAIIWTELTAYCNAWAFPLQLRMIDGELAFPDETPPHDWKELRISTSGGMITLRRDNDGISVVVWGNADDAMRQSWNTLTLMLARVTGASVIVDGETKTADGFAAGAGLPTKFS
ncbi:MAG: hypothetical protein EXS16_09850 [Gemmataceae bacterium]|nr:hypothetical protein [Gemmataceae bacterium]